jgi:uncharacterized RDD family membrane protein YckC
MQSFFIAISFIFRNNLIMKNNMFVVNANLFKRSGSAILDFVLFVVLGLSLISFAIGPIYDNQYDTSSLSEEFLALQKASYLYQESDDTNQVLLVTADNYPEVVFQYYSEFKQNKIMGDDTSPFQFSIGWYNQTILKVEESSSLFERVNGEDVLVALPKTTTTDVQLVDFYTKAYNDALLDLASYAPYRSLAQEINRYFIEILSIAFLISAAVLYFFIPLLSKHSQTLAKRAFGIIVVTKDGFTLQLWQKVVRFIALFATFVLAIYTVFGSILISYTFMIFTKNYRSLHDFIALTKVVDQKQSQVFDNLEAYEAYESGFDRPSTDAIKDEIKNL